VELLSELFGHERGAFTGAVSRKSGLLSVVDTGTLFLDEIGELSPEAQVMLLRFLQQGEVRPVGATAMSHVDVRLISATHRDLEKAVEQGTFREDLYYRLRRVVLEVPPLRERREDIPLLVEHVRRVVIQRHGLTVDGVAPDALATLVEHDWPGNVRELEAVLEQAMIFQGGALLTANDLPLPARGAQPPGPTIQGDGGRARRADDRVRVALRRHTALRIAGERGSVTRRDLSTECGISGEQARVELIELARRGELRRVGSGRSTRYVPA
jgi:DNA-binding NtrC family response regulator